MGATRAVKIPMAASNVPMSSRDNAALSILIYTRGYIHPAASMAMYSTQSAQDGLPPDSTPAL